MKQSLWFPVGIVRDALTSSDFTLLCTQGSTEHYVREGRHVAVHISGDQACTEHADFSRRGNRITVVIDGVPGEMFHVREEN